MRKMRTPDRGQKSIAWTEMQINDAYQPTPLIWVIHINKKYLLGDFFNTNNWAA